MSFGTGSCRKPEGGYEMKFSKNELNVICQNAAPTKAETLAGIKEIVSVTADLMTKLIMENAIRRLERIPEPWCNHVMAN